MTKHLALDSERPTDGDTTQLWDPVHSPLTISVWLGSPDAPKHIRETVAADPELEKLDRCERVPWAHVMTILHRSKALTKSHPALFVFVPQDLAWQVNGWLLQKNGIYTTDGGLVNGLMSQEERRAWPHLSGNPTTADFAAEVMTPKTLGLLIRYHTSAERAFHKAHNELVKTKKQRQNSEIGFESQNFGEEVPTPSQPAPEAPQNQPTTAPVVPSTTFSDGRPKPTFTADELDFELCPEALEYFKKVG